MTALDVLNLLLKPAPELESLLGKLGDYAPALKPEADAAISALNSAIGQDNLAAVAAALPGEVIDIAHGKLHPADHPSDLA